MTQLTATSSNETGLYLKSRSNRFGRIWNRVIGGNLGEDKKKGKWFAAVNQSWQMLCIFKENTNKLRPYTLKEPPTLGGVTNNTCVAHMNGVKKTSLWLETLLLQSESWNGSWSETFQYCPCNNHLVTTWSGTAYHQNLGLQYTLLISSVVILIFLPPKTDFSQVLNDSRFINF